MLSFIFLMLSSIVMSSYGMEGVYTHVWERAESRLYPLHYAINRQDAELLQWYLDTTEANQVNKTDPIGRTPLDFAQECGNNEMINILKKAGAVSSRNSLEAP